MKETTNSTNSTTQRMEEFCSRKLWEIVSEEDCASPAELEAAIRELAQRRHYLSELEKIGKLERKH